MHRFLMVFFLAAGANSFAQNTILWTITHPEVEHKSYLLGTFHQMGSNWVDSLYVITDALIQAELGIFESTETGEEIQSLMNSRKSNSDYRYVLKSKTVSWLEEYSRDWVVPLEKLNPVELHWKLQQRMAYDLCKTATAYDYFDHFDNYLLHIRDSLNLKNIGFETDSMQGLFINESFSKRGWADFRKIIEGQVKLLRRGKPQGGQCDFSRKYKSLTLSDYQLDQPCLDDVMIAQRNAEWMKTLPDLLNNHQCFVAVGWLHLNFECGLITSLRKAGYNLEPVLELAP